MLKHASLYMGYVNFKGKDGYMNLKPLEVVYAGTEWNSNEQWLLRALNTDRNIIKDYPLKDVLWWKCTDKKCTMMCKFSQWIDVPTEVNDIRMEQFKATLRLPKLEAPYF